MSLEACENSLISAMNGVIGKISIFPKEHKNVSIPVVFIQYSYALQLSTAITTVLSKARHYSGRSGLHIDLPFIGNKPINSLHSSAISPLKPDLTFQSTNIHEQQSHNVHSTVINFVSVLELQLLFTAKSIQLHLHDQQ